MAVGGWRTCAESGVEPPQSRSGWRRWGETDSLRAIGRYNGVWGEFGAYVDVFSSHSMTGVTTIPFGTVC